MIAVVALFNASTKARAQAEAASQEEEGKTGKTGRRVKSVFVRSG